MSKPRTKAETCVHGHKDWRQRKDGSRYCGTCNKNRVADWRKRHKAEKGGQQMLVGFGSTEDEVESSYGREVDDFIRSHWDNADYVTKELVSALGRHLHERSAEAKSKYDAYKTSADFPDRYSTFWYSVLHDSNNIVVIFRFHHINRRHAFSPDGWSSLMRTYLHHFDIHEDLKCD